MTAISPAEYETRIRQLEKQCAALSAQVDRQAKVITAVKLYVDTGMVTQMLTAYNDYEQQMAALTREAG